jgi:hypothetical protein
VTYLRVKNTEYLTRYWANKLSIYLVDNKETYPNVRHVHHALIFLYFDLMHTVMRRLLVPELLMELQVIG